MAKSPVEIGDRLELTHTFSAMNRALSENTYSSQLLDYDGFRAAKISMPIYEGRVVPLEIDDEFSLLFFSKKGLYQCEAKVINRYAEKNIYMIEMEFITVLKKFQRREYYRLDCMVQVAFSIEDDDKNIGEPIGGIMFDLSGGGLRLRCKTAVKPGNRILVTLPLALEKGDRTRKIFMKIIACETIEAGRGIYELRGEFEDLTEGEREDIIRFIFEEQRRRMRKE
ncbi:MAG: flagellar brake protein [Eubacterium sp.]|nr:flagellar brake protein [Eubacterium sp.]